jgi:uncharacterized protein (DUF2344 family)
MTDLWIDEAENLDNPYYSVPLVIDFQRYKIAVSSNVCPLR